LNAQCKNKISAFQQYIPLMHAVCNQGMRHRHWETVADETGIEVSGESTASLKYLLDNEVMEFLPRIVEISDTASREWSIEKALGKMLTDWADLEFEVADWKETGVLLPPYWSLDVQGS
jgi:dynein heavy chain, axonemal